MFQTLIDRVVNAKTILLDRGTHVGKWKSAHLSDTEAQDVFNALDHALAEAKYWREQSTQMASVLLADGQQDVRSKSLSKPKRHRRWSIAKAISSSLNGNGWIGFRMNFESVKRVADEHLGEFQGEPQ